MKAILISNPVSGGTSRKNLESAMGQLGSMGVDLDVMYTTCPGDATRLAALAVEQNPDLNISAGGDGTINETINGMAGNPVPLAILPLGTTNVLAREAGIPRDPTGAAKAAVERTPRKISLGRIQAEGMSRYFVLMAGVGFDALSVYNLSNRFKKLTGKLAYVASGLSALAGWKAPALTVRTADGTYPCASVIVSNAKRYGGDFIVAPDADISSDELHVTVLEGPSRLDLLRLTFGILRGNHTRLRGIRYFTASNISVDGPAHVQLDGDHVGTSPVEISIEPDALSLVY
jgi:YegS/Rv2252/BmrU family lipid kinase